MKASQGRKLPPVLMIHGAFCGPWSLEGLQEKFEAAGYAVAAPALRFHDGKRPPAALATTGLADYADDLEDEIASVEDGRPFWWGIPWADCWRRCWRRGSRCVR